MEKTVSLPLSRIFVDTISFLGQLFPALRRFGIRLWDGTELPIDGSPACHLVLNHPGAL